MTPTTSARIATTIAIGSRSSATTVAKEAGMDGNVT
jgi:hypothetical protein